MSGRATAQAAHRETADENASRALVPAGNNAAISAASAVPATISPTRGGMAMITPLTAPEAARAAIQAFEDLKSAIALPGDFVRDRQGRTYYKRKFWRRVALAFGLTVTAVSEERRVRPDGVICYSVIYRATAPNGQSMEGDGYCDSAEFGPTEHNTRAKAHTRAKNRAISDLVGGGEVSADEMPVPAAARRSRQQAAPARATATPGAATTAAKPPSWSSLRLRGVHLHYDTQAEWEEFVIAVTGKSDPKTYNDDDRRKVASSLDAQAAAEATGTDPGADFDDEWAVDEVPGEVLDEEEEGASPGDSDETDEHDLHELGRGKAARH